VCISVPVWHCFYCLVALFLIQKQIPRLKGEEVSYNSPRFTQSSAALLSIGILGGTQGIIELFHLFDEYMHQDCHDGIPFDDMMCANYSNDMPANAGVGLFLFLFGSHIMHKQLPGPRYIVRCSFVYSMVCRHTFSYGLCG
jgi:hypothetical protein